jgi:hypothetical protein
MARTRKTIDTFQLWTNYGCGWEHEVTEFNIHALNRRKREYRENCNANLKSKKVREPRANYTAEQLQEIETNNTADRKAFWERRDAKRKGVYPNG